VKIKLKNWNAICWITGIFALYWPLLSWQADRQQPGLQAATLDQPSPGGFQPYDSIEPIEIANHQVPPVPTGLVFPVAGYGVGAIISTYGDARSGGARRHEGIDIKADRGTPVVAMLPGRIHRVKEAGGGGKQVWLDTNNGLRLFYAHLDSWSVEEGQKVMAGDQLGTVGNTGNASHTLPHLHFGIYTGRNETADPQKIFPTLLGRKPGKHGARKSAVIPKP
jgi:murein DD-endopeptidase MepM/ murein hydrolase activator NlpD